MAHYCEFLILGDDRDLAAFLAGFRAGSGAGPRLVFAREAGFQIKALRELLKHRGEIQHVIAECPQGPWLRATIEAAAPRYRFEIKEERKVERAYFHFEFNTPSRKVAGEIKQLFATLPAGVKATDFEPKEILDPQAKGAEVYAPEHDYVYKGEGVMEGDVFGVVDAYAALSEIEFTKCDEIEVHHVA